MNPRSFLKKVSGQLLVVRRSTTAYVSRKLPVISRSFYVSRQSSVVSGSARGFTFLEILITMGIAAIIGFSVTTAYLGFYNRRQLDNDVLNIVASLRNAQSRAIAREGELAWGIRFVNNATSPDYQVLFKGPSYASGTVVSIKYLSRPTIFGYPISSSSFDVIYAQISGAATF